MATPPAPLTHQLSYWICTDLKIDPGEGWGGGQVPPLAPRGDATGLEDDRFTNNLVTN